MPKLSFAFRDHVMGFGVLDHVSLIGFRHGLTSFLVQVQFVVAPTPVNFAVMWARKLEMALARHG
jgi:hypothetical protein